MHSLLEVTMLRRLYEVNFHDEQL